MLFEPFIGSGAPPHRELAFDVAPGDVPLRFTGATHLLKLGYSNWYRPHIPLSVQQFSVASLGDQGPAARRFEEIPREPGHHREAIFLFGQYALQSTPRLETPAAAG